MQRFYVAIIDGKRGAYGVTFPDFPGCTSAGDTIDEAARNAIDALGGHVALMIEEGEKTPEPSALGAIEKDPEIIEVARVYVPVNVEGTVERVNVTFEKAVLDVIDTVASRQGLSRSAFLAHAGLSKSLELYAGLKDVKLLGERLAIRGDKTTSEGPKPSKRAAAGVNAKSAYPSKGGRVLKNTATAKTASRSARTGEFHPPRATGGTKGPRNDATKGKR